VLSNEQKDGKGNHASCGSYTRLRSYLALIELLCLGLPPRHRLPHHHHHRRRLHPRPRHRRLPRRRRLPLLRPTRVKTIKSARGQMCNLINGERMTHFIASVIFPIIIPVVFLGIQGDIKKQ
jgi:hypothetical protein